MVKTDFLKSQYILNIQLKKIACAKGFFNLLVDNVKSSADLTPLRAENNFSILANILVLKSWKMRFLIIFVDVTLISRF